MKKKTKLALLCLQSIWLFVFIFLYLFSWKVIPEPNDEAKKQAIIQEIRTKDEVFLRTWAENTFLKGEIALKSMRELIFLLTMWIMIWSAVNLILTQLIIKYGEKD
jgi:Na+/melibiose symporter-like transporter